MLRVTPQRINRRISYWTPNHPVGRHFCSRHRPPLMVIHNNHLWNADGCWSSIQHGTQTLAPLSPFLFPYFAVFNITARTDHFMIPLGQGYSGVKPKKHQTDNKQIKNQTTKQLINSNQDHENSKNKNCVH